MKKRADPEKPAQLWLNTFSDLMNLLLCFFVLLFAMSNVAHEEKFQELSASLSAAFNVLPESAVQPSIMMAYLSEVVQASLMR